MLEDSSLQSLPNESESLHLNDKLSFLHILGIAASQLAPSILYTILPTFFQPLSSKLHISQIWTTVLLLISSFSTFIISPLVGVYSDQCMFKWGRRRIYIVVSLFMMLIGLITMSYCCEIGEKIKPKNPELLQQIIFGFSYELSSIAVTVLDSPSRSICADITPISQQNLISNVCSIYGAFGGILVSVIGGLGIDKYTRLSQEQFLLLLSTLICTIAIIITVVVAHEEPLSIEPQKVRPFKQIFESFRDMPKPILHTIPSYFLLTITNFQFSILFSHFIATDIFKGDNTSEFDIEKVKLYDDGIAFALICSAVKSAVQFIYGFVLTKLCDLIGYKWSTFIGYTCITIGLFLFFFVNNKYLYLGVSVLIAIGYHTAVTLPFSIASISTTALSLDFGAYYGILMMFCVSGELISNLGIGTLLGKIWPNDSRMLIGISSVFGLAASLLSLWIIEPLSAGHGFQSSPYNNYKEI